MPGEATPNESRPGWRPSAGPVVSALVPVLFLVAQTALQLKVGLNLADEGFLWYGAQRTAAGEVPLRDFQAYEPGRYYWTAIWMWLARDDGIIVMRLAATAFEAVAIAAASLAVWRYT